MKNIVIFGATSAIAGACAREWASQGSQLFLIGRSHDKLQRLATGLIAHARPEQCIATATADLNDIDRHEALFAQAEAALGNIDVVFIAHGSLPDQKACERSVNLSLHALHTNCLSVVALLTLAANRLEAQGAGTIAVISSVAGERGRQSNYVYGSAKGMISIYLQGLRNRLAGKGVRVLTILPGFVDTPMTAHIGNKGILWAKPGAIACGIVRAIAAGRDVVYLPWFWRWIMLVIRSIPEALFKRLSL